MNYQPSSGQESYSKYYQAFTLDFSSISNSNGSVRFIDHSQGQEQTVGIRVDDQEFKYRIQTEFPSIIADIIDLAVAIQASDRLVPQNFKKARYLYVILPVRHPELMSGELFQTKLTELLEWATGSQWVFEFQKRKDIKRTVEQQLLFATEPREYEVALWSGGLDSLAGLYTRLKMYPEKRFALFGTGTRTNPNVHPFQERIANEVQSIFPKRCDLFRVQISFQGSFPPQEKKNNDKNKFSRARGVVFTLLGAACAYLMGQRTLHVYENGIGAINLFYRKSAIGLDHTRAVHPITLLKVDEIISELLGEKFQVKNPFLFWTKARMCQALAEDGRSDLALLTISCDKPHRNRKNEKSKQCGYCSSCILRRQALTAANIEDNTPYIVLDEKNSKQDRSEYFLHMREQVRIFNNLLSVPGETIDQWEALTGRYFELEDIVDQTAIAENLSPSDMQGQLIQLYQTYVAEWKAVESRIAESFSKNA